MRATRPGHLMLALAAAIVPLQGGLRAAAPSLELPSRAYGLDFWRESNGLPQSKVRAVVQTRDGYLWLGTDAGLVRFDGVTFTSFTVQTGSLQDNEVWSLKEDRAGHLWIGTAAGLTRMKEGRFATLTKSDGIPDDWIRQIDEDRAGNVWIATARGVCRYANGVFTV